MKADDGKAPELGKCPDAPTCQPTLAGDPAVVLALGFPDPNLFMEPPEVHGGRKAFFSFEPPLEARASTELGSLGLQVEASDEAGVPGHGVGASLALALRFHVRVPAGLLGTGLLRRAVAGVGA